MKEMVTVEKYNSSAVVTIREPGGNNVERFIQCTLEEARQIALLLIQKLSK